ncbi:MAG: sigma-54-dependent Fis family transcriptional regulator [Candidatus Nitronauta litoralis]|uniref:Sigma-54-dependent Fis family transcriptional regulator n=1 Tax=Candidatus Nitronauta litoralis TaxID=2705533 RepID=A0A7T0BU98_9BACT|nr:MAG: sigma-54-dependent Fis family transcriptional regulator [Candidatus Nitronauta litoralis]
MESGKIIFVDDEEHVRRSRRQTLELAKYEVTTFSNAEDALHMLDNTWPGILVSDIKMPGLSGLELLEEVVRVDRDLPVVLITGHGDVPMAVKAMQLGAYDFIEKPCPTDQLLEIVRRAMEKRNLVMENRKLRMEIASSRQAENKILGQCEAIDRLNHIIRNIAESDADVLILGETGTGKELVANNLHELSQRRNHPFVPINCGALPVSLIESELFGHEAGAFTNADQRRIGKFEYAHKGTIFLDEIESMPMQMQVRLLRVLQDRVVERLGSNERIPVDVRVIAATKIDLKEASAKKEFREDLYYRLNVVNLQLPPLRERREDIPLLFQHFVAEASRRYNYEPAIVPQAFMHNLISRHWEGNIRELKNESERFVLGLSPASSGEFRESLVDHGQINGKKTTLSRIVQNFEKTTIEQELHRQKGDIKNTYTALGIPRQTLYDKMTKYGLKRSQFIKKEMD